MKNALACLSLLLASCLIASAQQSSESSSSSEKVQAVVPRLIRFSGQLKDASGTVGVTFTLHKSQQDVAALWIETQNVQVDSSGRYTVLLGSTKPAGIPMELFTSGDAQWLAIRVSGQAEEARVLLVSVPYALKAAEAETLAGHAASEFITSDKLNSTVQQQLEQHGVAGSPRPTGKKSPAGPSVPTDPATNFVDNTANQVVGVTQNGAGMGLFATSTTGTAVRANSAGGTAIFGYSTGAGATALQGTTNSTTGKGIYGYATAATGINYGVLGSTASPQGIGIYGYNNATSGSPVGILGATASPTGTAIKAQANASTGANIGLLASSASAAGTALVLQNPANGKLISGRAGPQGAEVFFVDGAGNTVTENLEASTVNASGGISHYQYYSGGSGVLGSSGLNLFVGDDAGFSNVETVNSGIGNTFMGSMAGYKNQDGYYNTFVGSFAGSSNINSTNNTYVGAFAGQYATGNDNTFIGNFAGGNNASGHNNIYLQNEGCPQPCTESNTIRIGGDTGYGAQTAIYVAGIRGQTSSGGAAVYVASDGKLGTTTSSRRFKQDITDMGDTSKLFQLRPVTFFYKPEYDDGSHQLQYGLIAEEVAKVFPELVIYDPDGQPYTVKYQHLAPMLLNALQQEHLVAAAQQKALLAQQQQLSSQKQQLDELRQQVSELRAMMKQVTRTAH